MGASVPSTSKKSAAAAGSAARAARGSIGPSSPTLTGVAGAEEVWIPLVDEPIGSIVAQLQAEDPEIGRPGGPPGQPAAVCTVADSPRGIPLRQPVVEEERSPHHRRETGGEALA